MKKNIESPTYILAKKTKLAAKKLISITENDRCEILNYLGSNLELPQFQKKILEANLKDIQEAKKNNLSSALQDRLLLTEKSLYQLAQMCRNVALQPQVINLIESESTHANGLLIQKERIPLGVIAMIFESRPNVVIDATALAIKSGNGLILKGGKEAHHSNVAFFELIQTTLERFPAFPKDALSLLTTRDEATEILQYDDLINLVVPRGGSSLVNFVKQNSRMPVIAHDKGLCHIYVHQDADPKLVFDIILNAKVSRPGVCNALETLLVHEKFPSTNELLKLLESKGVEIKRDGLNFDKEWLDKILSFKIVSSLDEAITHINEYGSLHTEGILAKDRNVIETFLNSVDASCLVVNTSTRFNDGGELGLGAELGISTSKLHAYGAMGAKEMTTTRFVVRGDGQVRV